MSNVIFSLIVPIYNVKAYLDRCMESLLSQERGDYEIILVDDGSTDGCGEMSDSYAAKYSNVKCVHKENGGLSSARNKGLEYASGEYVLFVDSDDWIDNKTLAVLYEKICDEKPDVVKFNYIRMPERKINVSSIAPGLYKREEIRDYLLPEAIENTGDFILSAWSYLYRRELLQKNSLTFISERLIGSEDYHFNINVLLHAKTVMAIDEALYYYDFREGSLTGKYRSRLIEQYMNLYNELVKTCNAAGELHRYEKSLAKSYVWKCYTTCIPNEMSINDSHSFWDGVHNCKKMISSRAFRQAIKKTDFSKEPLKKRVRYMLMKANIVFPLVYSQYQIKNSIR